MAAISLLFLFFVLKVISAYNTCEDRSAVCINIHNCSSVIEILRNRPKGTPLSQETHEILRNAICGFEGTDPMVCCIQNTPVATGTVVQPTGDTPDPPSVVNHPNLRLLEHQTCGLYSRNKLIAGRIAEITDFPWMALLAHKTETGPQFYCGGTIISQRYILTAAHCVTGLSNNFTQIVRVGDYDLSKERDCIVDQFDGTEFCSEYQDYGVESVHFHPKYNAEKLSNDIALIRLNSSLNFTSFNIKPICLSWDNVTRIATKKGEVTGWGASKSGAPRSEVLLQDRMLLMTNEECTNIYNNTVEISYKQMCANTTNRIDFCVGDSGGPVMIPGLYSTPVRQYVRFIQYGVVSHGMELCSIAGFPVVFTRVSYYMDWILDTMKD